MRSLPEWQSVNHDTPIPPRVQWRIFRAHEGKCACCGRMIGPGERWQLDHIIALANGGAHRESNLQPLLFMHHLLKTRQDVAIKARNYRKALKHVGIKAKRFTRPLIGTRASGWKRKMDGTIEKR